MDARLSIENRRTDFKGYYPHSRRTPQREERVKYHHVTPKGRILNFPSYLAYVDVEDFSGGYYKATVRTFSDSIKGGNVGTTSLVKGIAGLAELISDLGINPTSTGIHYPAGHWEPEKKNKLVMRLRREIEKIRPMEQ